MPFFARSAAADSSSSCIHPRAQQPLRFIASALLLGLLLTGIPSLLRPGASTLVAWQGAFIGVTIAAGLAGVSALLGVKIGLPRHPAAGGAPAAGPAPSLPAAPGAPTAPSTDAPPAPEPAPTSTPVLVLPNGRYGSLQQIADWLTKILLGAGLTQLDEISDLALSLARNIAATVGPAGETAGLVFGLGLIGYFATCGFMGGYLATRLVLERLLLQEDLTIERLRSDAREQGRDQGREEGRKEGEQRVATSLNTFNLQQIALPDPRAETWQPPLAVGAASTEDPWKGRFGGKSTTAKRRLFASVTAVQGSTELFTVELKVTGDDSSPLSGPVKFFLHPTFDPSTVVVAPDAQGIARLQVVAWGAFTVGALADGGNTALELDLAELPSAPKLFRER